MASRRSRTFAELDRPMAVMRLADHRADLDVQRCKQPTWCRVAEGSRRPARSQHHERAATHQRRWDHERRVVIKAEVVRLADREPRDNPRFVVTNLRQTPRFIYEKIYCARGDIENRIKELLDGLQIDRTSCCKFWANQLRVFLTAAAYVLMQELRLRAARTAYARTQVTWLRDRLLKLGVDVRRSVRRLVLHLPRATPYLDAWHHIALALGARAGWPVLLPSAATSHSRADARPSRQRCRCRTLRARRHPATAAQPRRNLPRHSPQAARVRRSDPTPVLPLPLEDAPGGRAPNAIEAECAFLRTVIDIRLPSASRRSPFSAASGARHTAR